jgi:hypothetical protein
MPAVGVRVLAAFLLGAYLFGCTSKPACSLAGISPPDGGAAVWFDLAPVLGEIVPDQVQVWACLDQRCVRHVGSPRWTFEANDGEITDPEVDVRVVVRDHGRVVFDATRLVQLDEWSPNGPPGCEPTFFEAGVQATPEGDLIQK